MLRRLTLSRTVGTLLITAAFVLPLVPLRAQNGADAVVIQQVGQVSVMTDQRGYMTPLSQGMAIKQQQLIVTGPDGYAQFQVSDASTFEVFSNARVIFRPTLGNWKDLLNVWIGRVKVMIQHEQGKFNPNEVSSPTAVISVRGTIFDVVVEDDDVTLVTVDEGVVSVRNMTAAGDSVTLKQGDYVRVYRNQQLVPPKIDKANAIRGVMNAARDAFRQILIQRPAAGVAGGPGTTSGAQGDKGRGGVTGTGNGGKGAPGAPPAAPPGAPPAPPGGG